jgi:choline dehydrogenase-like flavoprotein
MADDQHYDVVIIGTGAGGGTLGHRLATNGVKVLWLERGPFLPRERDNWQTDAVFVRGKYTAQETWYDRHGNEFQPEVNYYVGGNTKFYGAALFRLRPEDFGELRHHGGISPAWPISYDDLEPYYTQAEHLYLVHGEHGEDPTEGPASKQYAYPPVSHEPRIQQLSDDLGKLGLHPFHLPIGVNLVEVEPGRAARSSVCIRCDRVDGFPCLLNAKSDSQVICVDPVLSQDNVTLITGANVQRLETDGSGRSVTGVVTLLEDGSETTFTGDIVVVACGAVNSAALLLKSRGDSYPDGLANSSGVVGRHYMRHNNDALMAVSREPNPTRFQKTLAMNDWYLGADDWDYPLGGIQMLGKSDDEEIHAQAPRWAGKISPDLPFEILAHHAVDIWLCGEDLPQADNRVTVDAEGAIRLSMHEHHLLDRSLYLHKSMPIGATAHQAGTVRFGTDPATSALDVDCKAHDVDNLYVVDTSFFPSIGAVNPSLTAIANALRVGDHITERLA